MINVNRIRRLNAACLVTVCLLLICQSVLAERARFFSDTADPLELAEFLFSDSEKNTDQSRSWVQLDSHAQPKVAALKILFEFDSAEIAPDSLETIGILAQALLVPSARDKSVLIEGHTDSVGNDEYNVELSFRRAKAVKEYLVDVYQIAPDRLSVDGLGESTLFTPDFPTAAINRRVQISQVL